LGANIGDVGLSELPEVLAESTDTAPIVGIPAALPSSAFKQRVDANTSTACEAYWR
jgi:hypothetical protein